MKKKLLVFAHKGEASAFLQKKPLRVTFDLGEAYQNDEYFFLITGEGKNNTLLKISSFLSLYKNQISHVTNLGIAGALRQNVEKESVYEIRTFYAEKEFKSFELSRKKNSIDCLTALDRIENASKAQEFSYFASLVDREGWYLGFACEKFKIPFSCYKLVSDFCDQKSEHLLTTKNIQSWSQKIFDFHQKNISTVTVKSQINPSILPQGFYFTVSQKKQFEELLQKLSLRHKKESGIIMQELDLLNVAKQEENAKRRTSQLLQKMQTLL